MRAALLDRSLMSERQEKHRNSSPDSRCMHSAAHPHLEHRTLLTSEWRQLIIVAVRFLLCDGFRAPAGRGSRRLAPLRALCCLPQPAMPQRLRWSADRFCLEAPDRIGSSLRQPGPHAVSVPAMEAAAAAAAAAGGGGGCGGD